MRNQGSKKLKKKCPKSISGKFAQIQFMVSVQQMFLK